MAPFAHVLRTATVHPEIKDQSGRPPFINEGSYVDYDPGDIENPRNWHIVRRWYITIMVVYLAFNGNLASSMTSGCLDSIAKEFGKPQIVTNLTTTLFLLGYCAGPFLFAPLSEFYGRRWIIYATFLAYFLSTLLCAWAPNFGGLLVGRVLAGTFSSAVISTAPGVLVDIWDPMDRGNAMAIYSLVAWIGPALGPIIAGFLQLKKDWRWAMYVLLWAGAFGVVLMITVPETHSPTILAMKAKRARRLPNPEFKNVRTEGEANKPTLFQIYKLALTRPWILLFDFISFLCSFYIAIVLTLQFMLFSIYPIVFKQMKGWNDGVSQLPLLGQMVGAVLGAIIIFIDTERRRRIQNAGKELLPEDRLLMAMVGGIGFPVSMFWFAWSGNFSQVHWIVSTLAGTFLATSLMLIFVAYLNYLTDAYVEYAASVIAANTVVRSLGSASAPLFTSQMFSALGVGGGGSLIAGVATLLACIPFVFHRYGQQLRRKSKYALAERGQVTKVDEEADPTDYGVFPGETQHAGELARNEDATER